MSLMQKDYVYPEVGDRTSPKEWGEQGSTDVIQKSKKVVKEILSNYFPRHIDDATDQYLRELFPVAFAARIHESSLTFHKIFAFQLMAGGVT